MNQLNYLVVVAVALSGAACLGAAQKSPFGRRVLYQASVFEQMSPELQRKDTVLGINVVLEQNKQYKYMDWTDDQLARFSSYEAKMKKMLTSDGWKIYYAILQKYATQDEAARDKAEYRTELLNLVQKVEYFNKS